MEMRIEVPIFVLFVFSFLVQTRNHKFHTAPWELSALKACREKDGSRAGVRHELHITSEQARDNKLSVFPEIVKHAVEMSGTNE